MQEGITWGLRWRDGEFAAITNFQDGNGEPSLFFLVDRLEDSLGFERHAVIRGRVKRADFIISFSSRRPLQLLFWRPGSMGAWALTDTL